MTSLTQRKEDRQSLTKLYNLLLDYLTFIPKEIISLFMDYLRLYYHRFQPVNVRKNLLSHPIVLDLITIWRGNQEWNTGTVQSVFFKIKQVSQFTNSPICKIGALTKEEQSETLFIQPFDINFTFGIDYSIILGNIVDVLSPVKLEIDHDGLYTCVIEMQKQDNHLSYYAHDKNNQQRLVATYIIQKSDAWYPYIKISKHFRVEVVDTINPKQQKKRKKKKAKIKNDQECKLIEYQQWVKEHHGLLPCSFCETYEFNSQNSFKTCDRCGYMIYCSENCRLQHWKSEKNSHLQQCRYFRPWKALKLDKRDFFNKIRETSFELEQCALSIQNQPDQLVYCDMKLDESITVQALHVKRLHSNNLFQTPKECATILQRLNPSDLPNSIKPVFSCLIRYYNKILIVVYVSCRTRFIDMAHVKFL